MAYLILAYDYDDKENLRAEFKDSHRQYLGSIGKLLIASGALLAEDGQTVIGGVSLLDTDDYALAKEFADNDPYTTAGIRKEISVLRWRRRWADGEFIGSLS